MSGVYDCSSCCDKATVCSVEGKVTFFCYDLNCVSGVYVCSSCCDKAAVCSVEGKFIVCYNLH